jgi:hypothetical protein
MFSSWEQDSVCWPLYVVNIGQLSYRCPQYAKFYTACVCLCVCVIVYFTNKETLASAESS